MRHFLILLCCVLWPAMAWAQQTTVVFDLEAFNKTAQRAEEVVTKGEASTEALEQLRKQLSTFRSQSLNQKQLSAEKVRPIVERLQALGPAPAEGETEAADVARLRSELNASIKSARAPVLAAEEAYQRADGIIKRIDTLIRGRSTDALLELQPTPLNPARWGEAIRAVSSYAAQVKNEAAAGWTNSLRKTTRLGNVPIVAVLFGFALLLLLRARRWSRSIGESLSFNASPRMAGFYAFIGSVAQLALPALGLLLMVQAIQVLDVFDLRGYFLLRGLGLAGFALYLASWMARSLFQPNSAQPALISLSDDRFAMVRRWFMILGCAFALRELLQAVGMGNDLSEDIRNATSTLMFPLVVLGGYVVFRIGRLLVEKSRVAGQKDGGNSFIARIGVLLGNFSVVAGVVGPLLAAIGYAEAGDLLVFSTALSLVLIAGFFILFRLIGVLLGTFSSAIISAGQEEDKQRFGALFQVALGFAFICVAIPLLAMIWGVRFSELQEIWFWLRDGVSIGETRISLTDFLTFVLIFSIGYTVTRLLQMALRTTVLPNTRLDSGGQNAIVTGTGYVGIFLAAIAAITATGLDLSNLAIVAGALSVGIGFGLQTIVSNFVSGIILLIERPIKAGDWIEVGAYSGYVRKISVRSTEVETFDRASVLIPNADLIAGAVTNWTHSSIAGRVRVPIGVAYGTDPRQVEEILLKVAEAHPMVLLNPSPVVMFIGFGPDSLDFEIRAILRDVNWMLSAKSDMNYAIVEKFAEAGIEIPFAQRDVHIKNLGELSEAIAAKDASKSKE